MTEQPFTPRIAKIQPDPEPETTTGPSAGDVFRSILSGLGKAIIAGAEAEAQRTATVARRVQIDFVPCDYWANPEQVDPTTVNLGYDPQLEPLDQLRTAWSVMTGTADLGTVTMANFRVTYKVTDADGNLLSATAYKVSTDYRGRLGRVEPLDGRR